MPMLIVEGHSQFLIPLTATWVLARQLHSPLQQKKILKWRCTLQIQNAIS